MRLLGAAIAVVLLAGVAAVVWEHAGPTGPAHPDEWDPRVATLAEFVEEARGLEFRHPVYVDFLTAEEYSAETTSDEADLLDEDRSSLDLWAAQLRALGVASGDLDLLTAFNQVNDGGTLAFYSPLTDRVTVRGTEMSLDLEVTIVHELTHALQDQHFDLDAISGDDGGASVALRALIEGDAQRIEGEYVARAMTEEQRAAYLEAAEASVATAEELTRGVPNFLTATFALPYTAGAAFVVMLANQGGDAIDEAFRHPPRTEEHLFDPSSYLVEEEAEDVDLGLDDVEVLESGAFGSPAWYLVLAERIDPMVAFDAALGWGGDAYALFERDGRACMRAAFRGDRLEDEQEMTAALQAWVDALPGDSAELLTIADRPGFEACDPGPDVDMALTGRSLDALDLPSLWGALVADAASVLDGLQSRCYAHHVFDGLTYEQIVEPTGAAFTSRAFEDLVGEAIESCW